MRIGIDLGTTYSLVGVMRDGRAEIVPNALGERQTPSAVSIDDDGTILVGAAARARALTHPERTFRNFKRDMGTDREVGHGGHRFRPEELSALVLRQLVRDAEAALGRPIDEAVVTVPAYFGELQRRATRDACEIAGLHVERLINEPTAAALAYGLHQRDHHPGRESRIAVLDLGGGTFDVSVLEIIEGVIEIQASAGDASLGGEDFVALMVDALSERAKAQWGFDPRSMIHARARLWEACERAKCRLSSDERVEVEVPRPGPRLEGGEPLLLSLSRPEAQALWEPILQRMHPPIRRALRDAGVSPDDVDEVVLVGGATRMPAVADLAQALFGRPALRTISPDEAVAQGAAVQVALKAGDEQLDDVVATDVAPFSLGVSTVESHGRRRLDDVFSPILERGTVLPASRVERFVTAADGQTKIRVEVFQGEHSLCRDNIKLGEYTLQGIPSGTSGEEAIDVRFTYDLNGILEVDMTIVSTGETSTLVIERAPGRMSADQVEQARQVLRTLKFHPREALPNTTALARAESLYTELRGPARELLGTAMRAFRLALEEQEPEVIERCRGELLALVERFKH
ncbi:Hsp70 family protein [Paraliomyxa miuraensis]|uniref:Hsp70 family protein n=1 Tax=Paraliomyxa miuraensis TaxID=376150 RepID=UPI00224D4032|nr:Hsp70 family protein [Paraliomyxa miuraensis]MCX4244118.1 heat shock 70 family protein [Paraliomyxa miuraensis]